MKKKVNKNRIHTWDGYHSIGIAHTMFFGAGVSVSIGNGYEGVRHCKTKKEFLSVFSNLWDARKNKSSVRKFKKP